MSHVFVRTVAYYSPEVGVVDLPIGLRMAEQDRCWISSCGTKVVHDAEVIKRFLLDGSLQELPVEAVICDVTATATEADGGPEPATDLADGLDAIPDLSERLRLPTAQGSGEAYSPAPPRLPFVKPSGKKPGPKGWPRA